MTIITTTKQMRPRDKDDFYPTPREYADYAVRRACSLLNRIPDTALDPGAGTGIWGEALHRFYPRTELTGIELRYVDVPDTYDEWHNLDYRLWKAPQTYDLVIGNPPYKHAEQFVRLGHAMLNDGGVMVYLLRLAFLEGQDRGADLWRRMPPCRVDVCSARPSFTGNGKTDATAYALYYWRKGWTGTTELGWMTP